MANEDEKRTTSRLTRPKPTKRDSRAGAASLEPKPMHGISGGKGEVILPHDIAHILFERARVTRELREYLGLGVGEKNVLPAPTILREMHELLLKFVDLFEIFITEVAVVDKTFGKKMGKRLDELEKRLLRPKGNPPSSGKKLS